LQSIGIDQFDAVIDNTGNPQIIQKAYKISKPQGKVILVGVPKAGNETSIYTLPLHFGKTIKGSYGGGTKPNEDIARYFTLFNEGQLSLKPLVTNTYTLHNINEAIADMRSGAAAGRCLIEMNTGK